MDWLAVLLIALASYFGGATTALLLVVWRAMALDLADAFTTIDVLREQLRTKREKK